MSDFFDFLLEMNFDKNQMRIEKYNLLGTSNYAIGLNHAGVTWAVTLRVPVIGRNILEFEQEKKQTIETANYLVKCIGNGEKLSENSMFYFRGDSSIVSSESVYRFFEYQNTLNNLIEVDCISGLENRIIHTHKFPEGIEEEKDLSNNQKEAIKKYLKQYKGSYFVSRGAPASETLCDNDYILLVFDIAKALAILHTKTGLKQVYLKEQIFKLFDEFNDCLENLKKIEFVSTDYGYTTYNKLLKKYIKLELKRTNQKELRVNRTKEISNLVKKEVLLRTHYGKTVLKSLIEQYEKNFNQYREYTCFTHNDPHCDNFIIVEYDYNVIRNCHKYMDRVFINEIMNKTTEVGVKYSVEYLPESNKLCYRNFEEKDEKNENVNIIIKDKHYDVHLIDIDDATGIDDNSKKSYLYDLLIFAMSVQNLSAIQCGNIDGKDIIDKYYEFRSTLK